MSLLRSVSHLARAGRPSARTAVRALATKANANVKTFDVARDFKGHKLESLPSNKVETTKEELMSFYRTMEYYRRLEMVADVMYKQRLIRGFCHLYDGQEAIVTGMEAVLKRTDSVITGYRDHCYQVGRGDTGTSMLAELMGRETGCSRGKGGSMHMYYPQNNFFGGNGIVGAQIPLGAGMAFAHKYRKDGGVSVAACGDGAANQGQVYEAANMAALWKLPVIFMIENNQYGMGTASSRSSASTDYYTRGNYVPGIWVDGMDVLACKAAFQFATEWCRSGKGPLFLEANTYRYHGHSMSDPGISYRSREEVESIRANRDCIEMTKKRLLDSGWATAEELKAVVKEVRAQVDQEAAEAKSAKELPTSELCQDIYAGAPPPFIRAVDVEKSWRY